MSDRLGKYLRYLGLLGAVKTADFDDDWSPVGPQVRAELRMAGLAIEEYGHILRTEAGYEATRPPGSTTGESGAED